MPDESIPILEQPKVIQNDALSEDNLYRVGSGLAIAVTFKSPVKETGNEDALLLAPVEDKIKIFAVADGVGGHASGAKASQGAAEVFKKNIKNSSDDSEIRAEILHAFEAANQAVLGLGVGAATTLSLVEIHGHTLQSYHVGDSLTLLVGQRGKVKFQTIPHSPVGYGVEAGLLNEREALHHKERHLVSNILGSKEMRIDIGPKVKMAPKDTLLICSDGVYDNLATDEIVEMIRKGSLKVIAQEMIQRISSRMNDRQEGKPSKPDDFTFILFRQQK